MGELKVQLNVDFHPLPQQSMVHATCMTTVATVHGSHLSIMWSRRSQLH